MSNISSLYKKELSLLYNDLKEYLSKHQELAVDKVVENPHTTRLLHAFSLLHANLNLTLEESFTNFIGKFFEQLYPHYNLPIPSLTILELSPDSDSQEPIRLAEGMMLEMEGSEHTCNFRLCYDSEVIPVEVQQASCEISEEATHNYKSILKIKLTAKANFGELGLQRFRFYINGLQNIVYAIYHNIFSHVVKVAVKASGDKAAVPLDRGEIKKVGFLDREGVLPASNNSFLGYRLITEFFVFPEKFLFFDLDVSSLNLSDFGKDLEIYFYLASDELKDLISADNFVLNVVPAINLFAKESDPIEMDNAKYEYPIAIEKGDKKCEVYSLDRVSINLGGEESECYPLFTPNYTESHEGNRVWYSTRRKNIFEGREYKGSKLYLSLESNYKTLGEGTAKYFYVNATCYNGNLPRDLYVKEGVNFAFTDNTIPISEVKCISSPTSVNRLCQSEDQKWSMIAHLSPHYTNLMDSINGKGVFQEILSMYCCEGNELNKRLIDSIIGVNVNEKVMRIQTERYNQFCKGTHIEFNFSDSSISQGLIYLFLEVIELFLSMYCSINSFVEVTGKINGGKLIYKGLPRNGSKCLI